MKTLILGLGNPILSDDSVGLHVVRDLRARLQDRADIDVEEDYHGGLRLMERMIGYRRAIIVDAILSGAEPGTVHVTTSLDIATQHSASSHDANLPTALALGRQAGAVLPADEDILIVAIEAADVVHFGERLSAAVEKAVPRAVEAVMQAVSDERWKT